MDFVLTSIKGVRDNNDSNAESILKKLYKIDLER